ncbi:hypothetical protein [Zobellia laminariae]|uniref:hypothetical protein n=1 Tax=Zobellia laminariae TaxID=248906 RepID=UPI0026F45D13|nr:hypothetical protein [Zobellia laminariae]WKX75600.1 hypothetical protein Q5W13_18430 [Zobellia laminariae]
MATYDIDRYDKYPRFHLFNCEVMANKALYRGKYIWANDKTVNVRNRQTKKLLEDVELKLCSKCARLLTGEINSTQEFYESNEHAKEIEVVEELNIYGYPKNWREIATDFKKETV